MPLNRKLGCYKILEIFIIYNNFKGISRFLKFGSPFFEIFNNREQFFIINLIIALLSNVFRRKISYRAEHAFIILKKDAFKSLIKSVYFQYNSFIIVKCNEAKTDKKRYFKTRESFYLLVSPMPKGFSFKKIV